jgi:hypothetical protein
MKTADITKGQEATYCDRKGGPRTDYNSLGSSPIHVLGGWPDMQAECESGDGWNRWVYDGQEFKALRSSRAAVVRWGTGRISTVPLNQVYDMSHAELADLKAHMQETQRLIQQEKRERQERADRNLAAINRALNERLGEAGPRVGQAYARPGQVTIHPADLATLLGIELEAK